MNIAKPATFLTLLWSAATPKTAENGSATQQEHVSDTSKLHASHVDGFDSAWRNKVTQTWHHGVQHVLSPLAPKKDLRCEIKVFFYRIARSD